MAFHKKLATLVLLPSSWNIQSDNDDKNNCSPHAAVVYQIIDCFNMFWLNDRAAFAYLYVIYNW